MHAVEGPSWASAWLIVKHSVGVCWQCLFWASCSTMCPSLLPSSFLRSRFTHLLREDGEPLYFWQALDESFLFLVFFNMYIISKMSNLYLFRVLSLTNRTTTRSRLRWALSPIDFAVAFHSHLSPSSTENVFSLLRVLLFQESGACFESAFLHSAQRVWHLYTLVNIDSFNTKK